MLLASVSPLLDPKGWGWRVKMWRAPFRTTGHSVVLSVISLLLTNTVSPVRACLSIERESFCGTQKEDGPLCSAPSPSPFAQDGLQRT
jgi:hypothetical protein